MSHDSHALDSAFGAGNQNKGEDAERRGGLPVSRRALFGAIGLGVMGAILAPVLSVQSAYALTTYNWGYNRKTNDAASMTNGRTFRALSDKGGFTPKKASNQTGPDGTVYRELWLAFGISASVDWHTELYYHVKAMAYNRCGSSNVWTAWEYSPATGRWDYHGWIDASLDVGETLKVSYGQRDQKNDGTYGNLVNLSEAVCDAGASYSFGSVLSTCIASGNPGDSKWYEAIDAHFQDKASSGDRVQRRLGYGFTFRRKTNKKRVTVSGTQTTYPDSFNHWRFKMGNTPHDPSRSSFWQEMERSASVRMDVPSHSLKNDVDIIGGIVRVLVCRDQSFAVSSEGKGADGKAVTTRVYNDATSQNWLIGKSSGLCRFRAVAAKNQATDMEQKGGRCDENGTVITATHTGKMNQRWWAHRIKALSTHDHFGYGSRGRAYQLFCDCSGRSLAIKENGKPAQGRGMYAQRDADSAWDRKDYFYLIEEVIFKGSVTLSSSDGTKQAKPGKKITCSLPYKTCTPKDRSKSNSVHYMYTWYIADNDRGANKRVVKAEYQCDNASHDKAATYTPGAECLGKCIGVRIRLKLDCGVYYAGEVWAWTKLDAPRYGEVRYHVDDPDTVWRTDSGPVYIPPEEGEPEPDMRYYIPASFTQAARKMNCHHLSGQQGLQCWYTDRNYTHVYTPREVPAGGIDLYGRNWACVRYLHGEESQVSSVYTAPDGTTGNIRDVSVTPQDFEQPYGTIVDLGEIRRPKLTYDGPAHFPLTVKARDGWYDNPQGTGAEMETIELQHDMVLYKHWDASTYDGYVSNGEW